MSAVAAELEVVKVRVLPDGRMSRDDAAKYLGIAPKTLYWWGATGRGPLQRTIGSRVFLLKNDLDAFIATGAREAEK